MEGRCNIQVRMRKGDTGKNRESSSGEADREYARYTAHEKDRGVAKKKDGWCRTNWGGPRGGNDIISVINICTSVGKLVGGQKRKKTRVVTERHTGMPNRRQKNRGGVSLGSENTAIGIWASTQTVAELRGLYLQ